MTSRKQLAKLFVFHIYSPWFLAELVEFFVPPSQRLDLLSIRLLLLFVWEPICWSSNIIIMSSYRAGRVDSGRGHGSEAQWSCSGCTGQSAVCHRRPWRTRHQEERGKVIDHSRIPFEYYDRLHTTWEDCLVDLWHLRCFTFNCANLNYYCLRDAVRTMFVHVQSIVSLSSRKSYNYVLKANLCWALLRYWCLNSNVYIKL